MATKNGNKILFVVFLFLGDSLASEFYVLTFRNTLCSFCIGRVKKKKSGRKKFVVINLVIVCTV